MSYENIKIAIEGKVGYITFDRPKALNALCHKLTTELSEALDQFEMNEAISVVVLRGSEKAFAAGADIKEMQSKTYMDVYKSDFITSTWDRVAKCRKPLIAQVAGYALGGGCEIAMMCDLIIAADNAQFSQPEVTIGTMPGAGGTQRLSLAIGKAKAMDMCLTGRMIKAKEAEEWGLVARVVPLADLAKEVKDIANRIASMSLPIIMMIKESINRALETSLSEGLRFERRLFHSTFSLEDRKEGMAAFLEKRKPNFKDH